MTAVVPVMLPTTQLAGDTSILNWIYAFHDAAFSNQVAIASPVYAGGKNFWGLHTGLLAINGNPKPALPWFQKAVASLH